ncbi:MAG: ISAs1 family transposase [Dehalococcoidia bacterium]|nr:ISAs1 family transposase [Dehalococcoidia bacterium]
MERDTVEQAGSTLMEVFATVPDPRGKHGRRHPLGAILGLAVCAMLCGSRSLYAIWQWGRDHGAPMAGALGFTREQTPAVSTLHEVFKRLDREAFERALGGWLQERGLKTGDAVAVDGKTLRGIHGEQLPGVHLVSAYAHQMGIVIGQQAVADKENELGAVTALLEQLDIQGQVVTGDAQFTQRQVCEDIVEKRGTICL